MADTDPGPLPGPPVAPELVDPLRQGKRCEDCAFYIRGDIRPHEEGECRIDPPAYRLDPELAGYRRLVPRTPACSHFMTLAEWMATRRNFGRVARALAAAAPDADPLLSVDPMPRP